MGRPGAATGLEAGFSQGTGCLGLHRPSYPPCLVAAPPPPRMSFQGESADVLLQGGKTSLVCVGPLDSGMEFQLRRGDKVLLVNSWSTNPDRVVFKLDSMVPGDGGLYTCRYHLRGEDMPWSQDSAPVELLLSDSKPGAEPLGSRGDN